MRSTSDYASIVQDLINSYRILYSDKVLTVQSRDATEDELKLFHSSSYINFLKKVNHLDSYEDYDEEQHEFGLGYDCPILKNNYDFIKTIAGGSITAAKVLCRTDYKIVINWFGGWHHAQRDSAAGFCYVNDVVLAIQKLTEKFSKILYLDLDIHHGDGVQNAFELSKKILTLSYHKQAPGFYPGTGLLDDVGTSKGQYFSINIPFCDGVSDQTYLHVFQNTFPKIVEAFQPETFVVQCGADSLNGDEVGQSNLTLETIGECVKNVLKYDKPTIFCGGGGYNFANTARLWTYLSSVILGEEVDNDIPDSSEFFINYGPTYELRIDPGKQKDFNSGDYINKLLKTVVSYCEVIKAQS
ncbi:histone deacetylase 8-like isoform X2 [Tribolium madens]|uniref:histone deacetylase 8-like isoform X2 n=1 Tax=Tribolium madens TaxID=41895 RepID=UPI001CF72657|nr:histone deacetylase 8-like isoform X2 [Tribolium madens]